MNDANQRALAHMYSASLEERLAHLETDVQNLQIDSGTLAAEVADLRQQVQALTALVARRELLGALENSDAA